MDAKSFLERAQKIMVMIENKQAERKWLLDFATNMTANADGEKVQSSGSNNKTAALDRRIDLESEIIKGDLEKLFAAKSEIIEVIEQLKSPVQYDALYLIYIQGYDFTEVAAKYNRSYSWATTIHGRALKNVQKILDERGVKDE